ncbi:hypothetical protein AGOR_G00198880 [Albula goreensis]|uniref:Uncharacterized protein n=1 Tax=Albula goreensis TaxID=1534307 RepID=A0A8T3CQS0_9TELE|nr:hypothetical protein AGOR_G00198880 [Albula goreensis]
MLFLCPHIWLMAVSSSGEGITRADTIAGGLWNSPRVPEYSKETQKMLKVMMQESKLTQLQQRRIYSNVKKEGALPVISTSQSPSPKPSTQEKATGLPSRRQKRSAEMCRSGNGYRREMFRPSATRDLEKEKKRLQGLFSGEKEEPKRCSPAQDTPNEQGEPEDRDRFEEVVDEIKDRMDFLDEMSALGRRDHYRNIIHTEISQKIRELELINKTRDELED